MRRDITAWHSPELNIEMPLVAYGHAGPPLLLLPTAAADFLEYERFHVIGAIARHVEAGRLRVYSVNSVNRYSLLNEQAPPWLKAVLLTHYDRYLVDEVVPWIRADAGDPGARPMIGGISLGAYLCANTYFKHPDVFGGVIAVSGTYSLDNYMQGYHDENVYFNNPMHFLANLTDETILGHLRRGNINLLTGQGAYEAPERTRQLAALLELKGVPYNLDVWGHDVDHDWPWWRKMFDYYVDRLFPQPVG